MEGAAGGGGVSPGAARVQEEPGWATFAFYMTIKEEVLVKEEPECASSADWASGTGAAHVVKDELELAPARVQHGPNMRGVSRPMVSHGEAWPERGGGAHRPPAGPAGAEHDTAQQHTVTDTLHHTAHEQQFLIDHVKVNLREASETLPNEHLFIYDPSDTSVKKYTCRLCNKKFRKDYLKIHERFHTGEKPYTCEVCKKQFSALGNLREHKRFHSGERPYSCDLCAKPFVRSSDLKRHERSHNAEKPYACDTCKKGFTVLTNLRSHIRTHTGETPYSCTMCDKQFTQRSALNKHKRSHTGEDISKKKFKQPGTAETQTYKCNTCGQIFLQKQCLIDHVNVHLREASEKLPNASLFIYDPSDTSVKKYTCRLCNKMYRKDYLKIHERLHKGEKPYTCEVCTKQFAVLHSLREHKRIHTGERPYSCDLCAKTFTRSSDLKKHECSQHRRETIQMRNM